jgi:hypothetical protein
MHCAVRGHDSYFITGLEDVLCHDQSVNFLRGRLCGFEGGARGRE